jgi:hypothetical protein
MGPSNVNHGAVNLEEQIKEIEREREREGRMQDRS